MKRFILAGTLGFATLCLPQSAFAMHIMEGFLPKEFSLFWFVVALPFLLIGIRKIRQIVSISPETKMLLGLAGAFIFILSALKLPSVTGSCSHPTGVGLSAVLFGPFVSSVLSGIVLLFQALLLAHGGITTWGANVFSMGIAGGFVAWGTYKLSCRFGLKDTVAIFLAAALGDWMTYMVTAGQLAMAFPDAESGMIGSYFKFLSVFAITQLPLAISEGLLSVVVYKTLVQYGKDGLIPVWWKGEELKHEKV